MAKRRFLTSTPHRLLTVADGGSLIALQKKGNLNHVEVLYNPDNYFSETHILVFNKQDLSVFLKNPTLKVHYLRHLPFGKLGLALSFPYMLFQTIQIIRSNKIKIIRARNAYLAGLLGVLAGKLTSIPTVVSLGGDNRLVQKLLGYYYFRSRFLSFRVEEFSVRNAERIFAINKFTSQYAIRLGAAPENIRLVPHRIDIDIDDYNYTTTLARKELGFSNKFIIMLVSRLERDKQVDVVIEAIPAILQKYPDAKFVFVGDGRLRHELEARIRVLKITQAVKFVGSQPRQQVVKYLAAATLVWIPMSGFVVYEAAAAKKPIIAFDVEWHSEFIQNGATDLLVKNRDVAALAEKVIELLNNPQQALDLAENAHRKLRDQFDKHTIIQKEIEAYRELLLD